MKGERFDPHDPLGGRIHTSRVDIRALPRGTGGAFLKIGTV